ncbi:cyclic AMP-responsive element-binding protein 3-like protein 3-A [Megalops cyprinoides]|uniref:cyclic AMP-responsive element-binding protein 3-like protein 3-A n=1 Tax=Megalops cyprinoides TaxID=118141 RepID=UPI001863BC75|nr:cyclic AMP-responsive element-binding protein 3-like protein 3-A [Megalops cyprinoides]
MAHASNKGYDGMELLDLLFDQADGILRHEELGRHGNQTWPITEHGMLGPACGGEDFLDTLLSGSDSVSVSGSPLWAPSPSDSGISEDPHSDQMDSPPPPDSPPFEPRYLHPSQRPMASPDTAEPDISIDLDGWESSFFPDRRCEMQGAPPTMGVPLTVKDLLLSGTNETPQQTSQQSFQELILNEDEKKLLAKEGVSLPSQLPLTKYEERILKKIRRKIRNKQSAQESRKKKKEYIDGLEGRMAACSAQNQELQRKVIQLEKNNTSLMEQLRRLQALLMNGSNKTAQTGTCILVLLLSFSLILFPSLQPFSHGKVSAAEDFSAVRVQSRSLRSVVEGQRTLPGFSMDKGVETIASLLAKLQLKQDVSDGVPIPHNLNHSVEEGSHRHGDPITGHIATVTWTTRSDSRLRPHADDM